MTDRQKILKLLARAKRVKSAKEIAVALPRLNPGAIRRELRIMAAKGLVNCPERGTYRFVRSAGQKPKAEDVAQSTITQFLDKAQLSKAARTPHERDRKRHAIIDAVLSLIVKGKAGGSPSQLAKDINFSRQKTHYYLRSMAREGLIERRARSTVAIYDITEKGRYLLRSSVTAPKLPIGRFENFSVAWSIVRDNPIFLPVASGKELRNGVIRTDGKVKIDGAENSILRFHSPIKGDALIVHARSRYAAGEEEAVFKATMEVYAVAQEIQRRHGLALGEPKIIKHGELAFSDPFVQWYKASGGPNVKTDLGWIDSSWIYAKDTPEKMRGATPGEIEFPVGKQPIGEGAGQGYIQFILKGPQMMAAIEESNEQIIKILTAQREEMATIAKPLKDAATEFGQMAKKLSEIADFFERFKKEREEQTPPPSSPEAKSDRRRYT